MRHVPGRLARLPAFQLLDCGYFIITLIFLFAAPLRRWAALQLDLKFRPRARILNLLHAPLARTVAPAKALLMLHSSVLPFQAGMRFSCN